ncbi:MAG: hypothetical protein E7161_04045 [Firmicutes bacterium]|nr:hypothetical protein [Bacillota bacterium]
MVEKEEVTKKKTTKNNSKNTATKVGKKSIYKRNNKNGKKKIDKKIIFVIVSIFIVILSVILSFCLKTKEKVVMTIDNIKYTESDFNMYAYLIKYEYFGIDGTDLSEDILNTQVSNDSEQTLREYLKEKTISRIKVSAAILRIASENNITLTEKELNEIVTEKTEFINNLGGNSEYKKMLKKNHTTTESYLKIAKVEKLYEVILNSLYEEGKRNDLTTEELETLAESYKNEYVKIKQIILLKKDLETNKYLDETTLNQKEILAKELVKMAKEGTDFDNLIEKYSESYIDEVESEYYLKSSLVEELRNAINLLNVGDISEVVSSDYAYHVVIREKLDNSKLEEYYDSKREEKLIEDISDNLEKIAIINSDYLDEITIK